MPGPSVRGGWAPVPSLPYPMDESCPECAAALVRSVAVTLDNGEVVVRPCFVLHHGWEGLVVPLPVVRSVFEIELLPCRCGSNGNEPDAIGTGDALCS